MSGFVQNLHHIRNRHPLPLLKLFLADFAVRSFRNEKPDDTLIGCYLRFTAFRTDIAVETMIVLACADAHIESEIADAARSNVVQHLPALR